MLAALVRAGAQEANDTAAERFRDRWTAASRIGTSGPVGDFSAVVGGDGRWVAVNRGMGRSNRMLYRDDDGWWKDVSGDFFQSEVWGVGWGRGVWLAVGARMIGDVVAGRLWASRHGVDWVPVATFPERANAPIPVLFSVAADGSRFVAVGSIILHSEDGVTWERPEYAPHVGLMDVTYGFPGFVAVGAGGTILRSQKGDVWERASHVPVEESFMAVAWGGDSYVAVGWAQAASRKWNGSSWEETPAAGSAILRSRDGDFWVLVDRAPLGVHLTGVAGGDGEWIAAGNLFCESESDDCDEQLGVLAQSLDGGDTWKFFGFPGRSWSDVAYDDSRFAVVGCRRDDDDNTCRAEIWLSE